MVTYLKSLANDFNGVLFAGQFYDEILAESGITTTLLDVNTDGADEVYIVFSDPLSPGEELLLSDVIAAHKMIIVQGSHEMILVSTAKRIISEIYTTVNVAIFPGFLNATNVKVVSYMNDGGVSYDIRVYDSTNNKVITSLTSLANTEIVIHDLGNLVNIPNDEAVIELQVRGIGETSINVRSGILYYS